MSFCILELKKYPILFIFLSNEKDFFLYKIYLIRDGYLG